ncbi:MAG: efflux RND transporter periplasmic adaptor subunit [Proteobacteria bacterium]|nr:efflux RND transporter periplasmic adaptor subunit [Pseudomonadota bacterium]
MKILILLVLGSMSFQLPAATVKAGGEIQALEKDSYSPPKIRRMWQYTISFMAPDGSTVEPGQPVLMFKTETLKERLMTKKGELSIKQSELENAKVSKVESLENKKLEIEEKKMLLDKAKRKAELPKSVIAGNDYQENQLKYQLAQLEYQHAQEDQSLFQEKLATEELILEANITKLDAEVNELMASIKSMSIFSGRKGIIMHKSGFDKNKFSIGDTVWGGLRVLEIADLDKMIARLEIRENDMSRVHEGLQVKFTMDAYPDLEFFGVIKTLSKVVRTKSKNQPSRILDAVVEIESSNRKIMRPGMSIKAEIMLKDL